MSATKSGGIYSVGRLCKRKWGWCMSILCARAGAVEGDMSKGEKDVFTDIYVALGGCLGKLLVMKNLNFQGEDKG